ncbi:MAG: class I SAM-dependent methyltransferase [Planctomycetaceae bacterium]
MAANNLREGTEGNSARDVEQALNEDPFPALRAKWGVVPAGLSRSSTSELLTLTDQELLQVWTGKRAAATTGKEFAVRGWYHTLYKDVLRGKSVLDVGSGLGLDGITFAQHGARLTFLDLVPSNLELLERLCGLLGVENVAFHYLESLDSIAALSGRFDVIWCQGSLINTPFDVTRREAQALLKHLPIGGRWIELAYPEERWLREGRLGFDEWGAKTDGGAPWVEWYDIAKLERRLAPADFDVVLAFNFHHDDFNWFDLLRTA